ncbi:lysophospholipid acyltransferase [Mycobacterium sp.]|uniref:lysophospholipid acyltransferase n=1 Tax=Mycobacterium sp. TaxID=1785 RepID=UPI0025CF258B|nr:lysophospholipid acyltransferase [Mycobacterium sp.]MBW0014243.1 lysophospholipid acyltransferase [Mycobacterium sp.]
MSGGRTAAAREAGRAGLRKALQRSGLVDESTTPLPTDADEVVQLLAAPWYEERLMKLAAELGRDPASVRAEAAGYLREMAPTLEERAVRAWRGFSRWFMRAYDVLVDEDQIAQLRKLDRKATLAFAFSHRSYLDGMLLPEVIQANRLSPALTFGGANLNFFPMGSWAKRTGTIFIRRQTKDIPVYRFVLRAYAAQLVQNHANLTWSIEGGRTRTGKLRPPVFGILRYITDAVDEIDGPEVYLVPTSIVYDQLHEVEAMTTEAYGAVKRPEDLRFLIHLARQQGRRLGRAYLDFGEPLPLRKRLEELRALDTSASGTGTEIERIALDVEHRINRATPVTPTAVVSLALLGADRSLTITEVLATVQPLASYIAARNWTVAGAADLTNRSTIRWTLHQLVASGVVTVYDAGTEPVWGIGADQHLVAAFYRNTAIHILVDRAIAETALLAATEKSADGLVLPATVRDEALALRELLKFEFLFSARAQFEKDLADEVRLIGPAKDPIDTTKAASAADVRRLLEKADLLLAHLVLRPFLDAYHIVADRLAALEDESFDEQGCLGECLEVGKQWELQRRIASAESRSMELFKTALRLARHRELVDGFEAPDIAARRREFADEIATAIRRVNVIAELARKRA